LGGYKFEHGYLLRKSDRRGTVETDDPQAEAFKLGIGFSRLAFEQLICVGSKPGTG